MYVYVHSLAISKCGKFIVRIKLKFINVLINSSSSHLHLQQYGLTLHIISYSFGKEKILFKIFGKFEDYKGCKPKDSIPFCYYNYCQEPIMNKSVHATYSKIQYSTVSPALLKIEFYHMFQRIIHGCIQLFLANRATCRQCSSNWLLFIMGSCYCDTWIFLDALAITDRCIKATGQATKYNTDNVL